MNRIRALIFHYRLAALLLVATALAMKAVVPSGFMVVSHDLSITVTLCSGMGEQRMITIPIERDNDIKPSTDKQVCHGSVLDKAASGGVDPVLLVGAIAFILALGFIAIPVPVLPSPRFLHPPLRGPPLTA